MRSIRSHATPDLSAVRMTFDGARPTFEHVAANGRRWITHDTLATCERTVTATEWI